MATFPGWKGQILGADEISLSGEEPLEVRAGSPEWAGLGWRQKPRLNQVV